MLGREEQFTHGEFLLSDASLHYKMYVHRTPWLNIRRSLDCIKECEECGKACDIFRSKECNLKSVWSCVKSDSKSSRILCNNVSEYEIFQSLMCHSTLEIGVSANVPKACACLLGELPAW